MPRLCAREIQCRKETHIRVVCMLRVVIFDIQYQVVIMFCEYRASCKVYYPDQQMHYIYKQYFIYRKHSYMFRCICIIFRESYPCILLMLRIY